MILHHSNMEPAVDQASRMCKDMGKCDGNAFGYLSGHGRSARLLDRSGVEGLTTTAPVRFSSWKDPLE